MMITIILVIVIVIIIVVVAAKKALVVVVVAVAAAAAAAVMVAMVVGEGAGRGSHPRARVSEQVVVDICSCCTAHRRRLFARISAREAVQRLRLRLYVFVAVWNAFCGLARYRSCRNDAAHCGPRTIS